MKPDPTTPGPATNRDPDGPSTIHYAAPAGPREPFIRRTGAAIVGTAAGLLATLTLICGISGVFMLVRHWRRWGFVDNGDLFEVVLFNLIGLFCGGVAVRWIVFSAKGNGRANRE